jgi:hypothetical protein
MAGKAILRFVYLEQLQDIDVLGLSVPAMTTSILRTALSD